MINFCTNCGNKINGTEFFCTNCGNNVKNDNINNNFFKKQPSKKKNKKNAVVAVILSIVKILFTIFTTKITIDENTLGWLLVALMWAAPLIIPLSLIVGVVLAIITNIKKK